MKSLADRLNPRAAIVLVAVILLAATFFLVRQPPQQKHLTAHFSRAVSIYKGTDVMVLGVKVGRVTAVIPEGNSVRVDMEYDGDVKLPPDAKAVIITPTLVADRFVQITPVWTSGPTLKEDADLPLPDTAVPVELDRIYAALQDLATALGPNGVNKDGTLNHLLQAGANALNGQGQRGNQMITELSQAAQTFGQGAGPLFDTVDQLATFTNQLASNDTLVRSFVKDLAGVSSTLSAERTQIQRALAAVANAVGTVKNFVHDNRAALVDGLDRLTKVMSTINSERDSINTALTVAPVAINNLTLAYNTQSGTIGSRIGIQGQLWDADGFLCAIVQQSSLGQVQKNLACQIFKELLQPVENNIPAIPPSGKQAADTSTGTTTTTGSGKTGNTGSTGTGSHRGSQPTTASDGAAQTQLTYASGDDATLTGLLGGTP